MLKTRKRWISLLVTLAMLVAFVVPFAGPASAATSYSVVRSYNVDTGTDKDLGLVLVQGEIGALQQGDVVTFALPTDFSVSSVTYGVTPGGGDIDIYTPSTVGSDSNALVNGGVTTIEADKVANNEVRVKITGIPAAGQKAFMYIAFKKVDVPSGFSGDIKVTVNAGSGFSSGTITLGTVAGGKGTITIDSVKNITASSTSLDTIRIAENVAGALKTSATSIKLTLPKGFKWTNTDGTALEQLWGDRVATIGGKENDGRTLKINVGDGTGKAKTCWKLVPSITVNESEASFGDVELTIGGDSDIEQSSLVVAKYVDYGITVSEDTTKEVVAGRKSQEIGKFIIEEAAPGSLIPGRSITLKLPENAKFDDAAPPTAEYVKGSNALVSTTATKVDSRTYKFTVSNTDRSEAAKIRIKGMKVHLAVDVAGDIKITVGGSAGAEGEVKVATVLAPVTASVAGSSDVKIGVQGQAAQDITIVESKKEALMKGNLELWAPEGVTWATIPTVTVTAGDVSIDTVKADANKLSIVIGGQSSKASTLKISGIKFDVDRTVPEGPMVVRIKGSAVTETAEANYFETATTAAKVIAANVVTPAPGEEKGTAVFKIGETKYTVNGQEFEMDVAPIAEAGRTYLPARFVANAMGVPDANILWDQASKTVTVIRGERFVQMKVGSKQILVNGITLNMDVAPKVVPGRVLIPFRFLAQALGAEVVWDPADPNTIILNF